MRRLVVSMATTTHLDLEAFVAGEYSRVVAAVRLITGDYDLAADCVQDAMVGLLSAPPQPLPRNYAAYITVVASNKARDALRRRGAEQRALNKLPHEREAHLDGLEQIDLDVAKALRALPERQREICVMHYLLDHSIETIAEGLGLSVGTVKTQLHRARKTLAHTLGQEVSDD